MTPVAAKFHVCRRLARVEALELAAYFEMSRSLRDALEPGLEAFGVWDHVESVGRLADLSAALHAIGRGDLVARFWDGLSEIVQMAEPLPAAYVDRPELVEQLVGLLCAGLRPCRAAVRGAGGFGKTTLAQAVVWDARIRATYSDGVLWVTVGEDGSALTGLNDLVGEVTGRPRQFPDVAKAGRALTAGIGTARILLVVDDVWQRGQLVPFESLQTRCPNLGLLVTTRDSRTLAPGAPHVAIAGMTLDQAERLLLHEVPPVPRSAGYDLADDLGRWPLLLELVNAALRDWVRKLRASAVTERDGEDALAHIRARLKAKGLTAFDREQPADRRDAVAVTVQVSLENLATEDRGRFLALGVFPADADVPVSVVARLWGIGAPLIGSDAVESCDRLADRSLILRFDARRLTVRLHDAIRDYIREHERARLAERNRHLLGAFRPEGGWAELPADERYLWRHLAYHLAGAGQRDELRNLLFEYHWLRRKLDLLGGPALLADFTHLDDPKKVDEPIGGQAHWLFAALRLSVHALALRPNELAGQLHGRLDPAEGGLVAQLLDGAARAAPAVWVQPLSRTLTRPGSNLRFALEPPQEVTSGTVSALGTAEGPDGRPVALTGHTDGTLIAWNPETAELVWHRREHADEITAVAFTPGEWRLALTASLDGSYRLWDVPSATASAYPGDRPWVLGLDLARTADNGLVAVSCTYNNQPKLWDAFTGAVRATLDGHAEVTHAVAASPDGRVVVSGAHDGSVAVWDARDGQRVAEWNTEGGPVVALAIVPESGPPAGYVVLVTGSQGAVEVWRFPPVRRTSVHREHTKQVNAIRVYTARSNGQDRRRVLTAGGDRYLGVWGFDSEPVLETKLHDRSSVFLNAVVLADGSTAVTQGLNSREVRVWNLAAGDTTFGWSAWAPPYGAAPVKKLYLSPDGTYRLAGFDDGALLLWTVDRLTGPVPVSRGEGEPVRDLVGWSAAGRPVAAVATARRVCVWDLGAQALVRELTLDGDEPQVLWAAPGGSALLAGGKNGELWGWRTGDWSVWFRTKCHDDTIRALAAVVAGDDVAAVTGSRDGSVSLTTEAGRRSVRLGTHGKSVTSAAIAADGSSAVSGGRDHAVLHWDLRTGAQAPSPFAHGSDVHQVLLADGRVISIGDDRVVATWEWGADAPAVRIATLDRPAVCMTLLRSATALVVGGIDNTVRVLELPTLREVASLTLESTVLCVRGCDHPEWICAGEASGEVHHFAVRRGSAEPRFDSGNN